MQEQLLDKLMEAFCVTFFDDMLKYQHPIRDILKKSNIETWEKFKLTPLNEIERLCRRKFPSLYGIESVKAFWENATNQEAWDMINEYREWNYDTTSGNQTNHQESGPDAWQQSDLGSSINPYLVSI